MIIKEKNQGHESSESKQRQINSLTALFHRPSPLIFNDLTLGDIKVCLEGIRGIVPEIDGNIGTILCLSVGGEKGL